MNVRELMEALQALIATDPTIADLDVYTWLETQESYDAEQAAEDYEGPAQPEGAVVDVIVPNDIDKDGNDLGSYVVIRSILEK